MAEEPVVYRITTTGAEQAARSFTNVGTSIKNADKAAVSFNSRISGTATAFGGFTTVVAAASPQLAGWTFALNAARTALTGLVTALGGPGGLVAGAAVGGVIAAIAAFAKSQDEAEEAAAELNETLKEQERAFADLVATSRRATAGGLGGLAPDAGAEARVIELRKERGKLSKEQAREERLLLKRVRTEEEQAELQGLRTVREQRAERLKTLEQLIDAETQLLENRKALRQADLDAEVQAGEDEIAEERRTAAEKAKAEADKAAERASRREAERQRERERDEAQFLALDKTLAQAEAEEAARAERAFENRVALQQEEIRLQTEAWEEEVRIRDAIDAEAEAKRKARAEEAAAEAERQRDRARASIVAVGDVATQSIAAQFSALAKGAKFNAAAILETVGDVMVAEGTRVLFQAAVQSVFGNPQGGALFAIGTAEIAAGLALGAAGARGGPPGAGGSGGRPQPVALARPVVSPDGGTASDQTVIVNVSMPTVVSPTADDGLRVMQATEEAYRVHGVGLQRRNG